MYLLFQENKIWSSSISRKQLIWIETPLFPAAWKVEQGNDNTYALQDLRGNKELFKLIYLVDDSFSKWCSCTDFWGGGKMVQKKKRSMRTVTNCWALSSDKQGDIDYQDSYLIPVMQKTFPIRFTEIQDQNLIIFHRGFLFVWGFFKCLLKRTPSK